MASKVINISLPEELPREIDAAAAEHRSRSGLLRESARQYLPRQQTVGDERWRAIQAISSDRAGAAGLRAEDDVEAYLNALPEFGSDQP